MPEQQQTENCRFPDGQCEQHKIWAERRKNEGKMIDLIPGILTVQNKMIGGFRLGALVLIFILCASFLYTKESKQDLVAADKEIKHEHSQLYKLVTNLEVTVARNEAASAGMVQSSVKIADSVKQLITKMEEKIDGKNIPEIRSETIRR